MNDVALLAKAAEWAAETDWSDGEALNIPNGDFHRWEHLWPRRADHFRLPPCRPKRFRRGSAS
jgi:hypothetical protein